MDKHHGTGSDLARRFLTLLDDRPDLQRQYLGGEIPNAPAIGTIKPGGEFAFQNFVRQARAEARRAAPAADETEQQPRASKSGARPNLLELTQEIHGTPENDGVCARAFRPL